MWSILFDFDLVLYEFFYTYHCTLTLFHDTTLLPTTKVSSHPHFVYYFVIMTYFLTLIILASIDLLVNCHVWFTLFSIDPFFRGLEGCYGLYRTFLISNLIPKPRLRFFANSFSKEKSRVLLGVLFLLVFPFKNK